jgi:hypothetical protein
MEEKCLKSIFPIVDYLKTDYGSGDDLGINDKPVLINE